MKNLIIYIFFTVPLIAQNVSVEDYEVPVSTARTMWINANWNWSQVTEQGDPRVTSSNASGNMQFNSFYSSLPFAWFIDMSATGEKNFDDYSHNIVLQPSIRKYLVTSYDFFGFASADIRHDQDFKQISAFVTTGIGYGRYINATALAKAVRIEEHLINEEVIDQHLGKETMIAVAHIIEREDEYEDLLGDTYESYWYEDIESKIVDDSTVTDSSLGAVGILRMRQVLSGIRERVNERYYGWDVSAGIRYHLMDAYKTDKNDPSLSLSARFSYPITWRNQINAYFKFYSPLNEEFLNFRSTELEVNYIYELSNIINLVLTSRIEHYEPVLIDDYFRYNIGTSFLFYLENNIYLTANASMINSGIVDHTFLNTSMSLQYHVF